MMIRQDFDQLPPRAFLMQVMDDTAKEYCFLWDKKNSCNQVRLTWKEIFYHCQKNAFRSRLRKLNNIGLLSFWETPDDVTIELVGYSDMLD